MLRLFSSVKIGLITHKSSVSSTLLGPLFVWLFTFHLSQATVAGNLAVIYPEIRDPYRQIFLSIYSGIESEYTGPVLHHVIPKQFSALETQDWIKSNNSTAVIALGRRGLKAISHLPKDMPIVVVVGAILINPNGRQLTGISLAPEPKKVLETLIKLKPKTRNVYLIHKPDQSNWLIDRAQQGLKYSELSLNVISSNNIQQLAQDYRKTLENMSPETDALWISFNGKSIERSILQETLKNAWTKNLTVFSSNLADVKRGALFSLYPDNESMGKHLAQIAINLENDPDSTQGIMPANNLKTAVNIRTADHIGINFTKDEFADIDITYPAR